MATPMGLRYTIPSLPQCLWCFQSPLVTERMINLLANSYENVKRSRSKLTSNLSGSSFISRPSSVKVLVSTKKRFLLCHPHLFHQAEISNSCKFYHTSQNLFRNYNQIRKALILNNFGDLTQSRAKGKPANMLEAERRTRERQQSHTNVVKKLKAFPLANKDSNNQNLYNLFFENLNEQDEMLGKLRKTVHSEKYSQYRKVSETIILEGGRLIKDALLAGAEATCLCFCRPEAVEQLGEAQSSLDQVKLYRITPATMKAFSDTVTPGGLLGIFRKPGQGEVVCPAQSTLPISLVCDRLKDPGNAGTLIRTAAAIGCRRIFATEGCVNLWERKVLRSAMGAHFNMAIYTGVGWGDLSNYLSSQCQVFLASNFTASTLGRAFDSHLDPDHLFQDTAHPDQETENIPLVKNKSTASGKLESLFESESDVYKFHNVPLPVYDYSEIPLNLASTAEDNDQDEQNKNFIPNEKVLVIGNEADGLSALAKKFAYDHYGAYVTIPMNETTNSLNSGIAGSIILYELRRKLAKCV